MWPRLVKPHDSHVEGEEPYFFFLLKLKILEAKVKF
jgi:hypothetical protein